MALCCAALCRVFIPQCAVQVFSLLGDLFAPDQRAFVAALVQIAMGAGMSLGQLTAGVIGEPPQGISCLTEPVHYRGLTRVLLLTGLPLGWRASFVVVALPIIALTGP